ncbi:ABC transporter permease [Veillonella magna]|uniref:ABC transporter permease n=2 Tax=Veillonella TaxID=29465 RepID=A0ABS2GFA4_9FIRM|nr:ABC transporter permease [Veillonella magna]MBM6823828.1 ABC transporter permease [Veillonella magna]MBM6911968.1 ABC transporter permease [Veillonella magna]
MYKEGFIMAWASLIANKMRSLLTMLGIIIGVAAVIALVSIGFGVRQQIQDSISSLGSNLLMVYPGAPRTPGVRPTAASQKTLKVKDYETLKKLNDVDMISPVAGSSSYVIVYTNKNWTTTVNGINSDFQYINNWTMKSGRFITDAQVERRERVAVIGSTVAKNLFGDENPVGKDIRIKNDPFKVVGVLDTKGSGSFGNDQDDIVFIPYTTAMERVRGVDYLSMIYIKAKDGADLNRVQSDIENIMRVRHKIKNPELDDFNVRNMATIMETVNETTGTMTLFLGAVAAISLLVGGIGIMNIMLVSVTERTREIGVRKALGATYRVIVMQFLIEAVVISLIGGAIGVVFGIGASKLISAATSMKTVISMGPILLSFGFSMAIGLIFGIYPARKAAKLNPIDALHYE